MYQVADQRTVVGRYDDAIALFEESLRLTPDRFDKGTKIFSQWFPLAVLTLRRDDRDGYRVRCSGIRGRFNNTQSPAVAEQVARLCCAIPGAVNAPDELLAFAKCARTNVGRPCCPGRRRGRGIPRGAVRIGCRGAGAVGVAGTRLFRAGSGGSVPGDGPLPAWPGGGGPCAPGRSRPGPRRGCLCPSSICRPSFPSGPGVSECSLRSCAARPRQSSGTPAPPAADRRPRGDSGNRCLPGPRQDPRGRARLDRAALVLREAIRLDPVDAATHLELAKVLGQKGPRDEAECGVPRGGPARARRSRYPPRVREFPP